MKKTLAFLTVLLTLNFFVAVPPAFASSATITFTAHAVDSTSGVGSYTFSGKSIGTASSDRIVLVDFSALVQASASSLPTCTIAGTSATNVAHIEGLTSTTAEEGMYWALITSGTTADIVCTATGGTSFNRGGIMVWVMTGIGTSPTVYSTGVAEGTNVTIQTTVNIAAGGVVAGGSYNSATEAGDTCTWTGLATTDVNETLSGNVVHSGAHDSFASASSGSTMKCVWTGGTNQDLIVVTSWQPSATTATFNPYFFWDF